MTSVSTTRFARSCEWASGPGAARRWRGGGRGALPSGHAQGIPHHSPPARVARADRLRRAAMVRGRSPRRPSRSPVPDGDRGRGGRVRLGVPQGAARGGPSVGLCLPRHEAARDHARALRGTATGREQVPASRRWRGEPRPRVAGVARHPATEGRRRGLSAPEESGSLRPSSTAATHVDTSARPYGGRRPHARGGRVMRLGDASGRC